MPIPTIAAIDGPTLGGSVEIVLCCDLRVLKPEVKIGLPGMHFGWIGGE